MTIAVGDRLPSVTMMRWGENGPEAISTDDLFKGKRIALFGVPGAFTPTCSAKHLPGFVQNVEALRAKGVDAVVCTSVNDAFVMNAWGKDQACGDDVLLVADGDATFAKATGLQLDLTGKGLGLRNQRFSMLVDDGVVKVLNIDASGFDKTSADTLLSQI